MGLNVRDNHKSLITNIQKTLETSEIFSTEIKVFTAAGEEKWYRFDLQKRELDNAGVKLMCYMVNIEKEQQLKEKVSSLNQYLEAFQSVSQESYAIIDLEKHTITQKGPVAREMGVEGVMENFPECTFGYTHPDDLPKFKVFTDKTIVGETVSVQARMKTTEGVYQWYEVRSQGIVDENGNVTQLVGKIGNIQKQKLMQEEVSSLNQYLEAAQSISGESLFYVDMKTKILRQKGAVAVELGLPDEIPNFPEGTYAYILEEDLANYKQFGKTTMEGKDSSVEVRVRTANGDYQWYEIISMMIYDDFGEMKEVFGRMTNIQAKYEMETEHSLLNKYLGAMQELTDNVLYRVDVSTMTLYHTLTSDKAKKFGITIPDYANFLVRENIVHPEDAQTYLTYLNDWYHDKKVSCRVRFAFFSDEYIWYDIRGKKILDEQGNLKEVLGSLVNVSKEESLIAEFSESNQYFEAMQELSDDIYYRIEVDTMTLHHSLETNKEIAKERATPDYVNTFISQKIVHPDDAEQYLLDLEAFNRDELMDIPVRFALLDDEYRWYIARGKKIFDENGTVTEILGRLISVQEEKEAKIELSIINQYFSAVQDLTEHILFHIDVKTKTFRHSDPNAQDFGVPVVIPNFVETFIENQFVRPEDADKYREYCSKLMSGENMEYEIQAAVGVGVYEWFHIRSQFVYNDKGVATEIFGTMENIQNKKDLEQKAKYDLMTKVLNKVSFEVEAEDIMINLRPEKNHALIFIDLDDFKGVNDKLGHSYGDALLTTVGKRLKRHVREGDLVGRIGGDEFAVLLCNIADEQSVLERINAMLESVKRNFSHEGTSVGIKASVGVAIYPQHGTTYKDLIGKADIAVYESKRRGKNVVSMYSVELEEY